MNAGTLTRSPSSSTTPSSMTIPEDVTDLYRFQRLDSVHSRTFS